MGGPFHLEQAMIERGSYEIYCVIAQEEAFVALPYPDGEDPRTKAMLYSQGIGHSDRKLTADSPPITLEQAWWQLGQDVRSSELWLTNSLTLDVTQQEYDALLSPTFARGATRMLPVISYMNSGQKDLALQWLMTLCLTSKGKFSAGLAGRRMRETKIFQAGDYGLTQLKCYYGNPWLTKPVMTPFPTERPKL